MEGLRDGLVDLDASDVEAIDAPAFDQDFAGAMIPRRGAASAIVRVQAASAAPAGGKRLAAERSLLSRRHRPALCGPGRVFWAMRSWLAS